MATITFERDSDNPNGWVWHHGSVNDGGIEYPFSILEMRDSLNDTSQYDLTWCDDTPENHDELKSEILEIISN